MMHPAGTRGNVRMLKCTLVNMIFMGGCYNLAFVGANGTNYSFYLSMGRNGSKFVINVNKLERYFEL